MHTREHRDFVAGSHRGFARGRGNVSLNLVPVSAYMFETCRSMDYGV